MSGLEKICSLIVNKDVALCPEHMYEVLLNHSALFLSLDLQKQSCHSFPGGFLSCSVHFILIPRTFESILALVEFLDHVSVSRIFMNFFFGLRDNGLKGLKNDN